MITMVESIRAELRAGVEGARTEPGTRDRDRDRDTGVNGTLGALLDLVGELARPEPLTRLISSVLDDPREPVRNAPASFRHTLGFEKLVLVSGEPSFMLRLHLWHPVDGPREPGHIHNHRAAVVSTVVRGELEKQTFARDPAVDAECRVTEYREERTADSWLLQRIGPAGLRRTGQALLGPGTRYALPAEALHRIGAAEDLLTMTLFLETAQVRTTTEVFTAVDERVPESIPKHPLPVAAYRQRLESALKQVEAVRN